MIPRRPKRPRVLSDIESYDEEESDGYADGQVLQYLLRQQGVKSFQCLEEIDPFIDEYEKRSQNKLKIKKSSPNCFRPYVCNEHTKCQYQIFVRKRPDGLFAAVKRIISLHFGYRTMISSVASRQPRSSKNTGENEDNKDEDEDADNDDDDEEHNSDASFNTAKSSAEENDDDAGTVDKLFEDLLKERNVNTFPCLEGIDPIVDLYEKKSGNHLSIFRSLKIHIDGIFARNILTVRFKFLLEGAEGMACFL